MDYVQVFTPYSGGIFFFMGRKVALPKSISEKMPQLTSEPSS